MTDRDRLIELFEKTNYKVYERSIEYNLATQFNDYALNQIVDELLANGVIVPPCKVGDTIYKAIFYKGGIGSCVEHQVVGFHLGDFPKLRGHKRKQYFIVWHKATNSISHLDFEQIGKTIFFTREEAEQALKERKNNG